MEAQVKIVDTNTQNSAYPNNDKTTPNQILINDQTAIIEQAKKIDTEIKSAPENKSLEDIEGKIIKFPLEGDKSNITSQYANLHMLSLRVCECIDPYLKKDLSVDTTLRQAVLELNRNLNEFNSDMKSSLERAVEEEIKKNKQIEIKCVDLANKLNGFHTHLKSIMNDALNPTIKIDIAKLKETFKENKAKFEKYLSSEETTTNSWNKHEKPLKEGVESLKKKVSEYENKPISREHIGSIAIFLGGTTDEVNFKLEAKEKMNEEIKAQHDSLCKAWANILCVSESVEWQLDRIDMYSDIYTDAKKLGEDLAVLASRINILKEHLRKNNTNDTNKQKEMLKDAGVTLESIINTFKTISLRGGELNLKAESSLSKLKEPREKLIRNISEISVYSNKIEKEISGTFINTTISNQDEMINFFQLLELEWKTVKRYLGPKNLKESLVYEINRLHYAITQDNGKIPADMTHTWLWKAQDIVVSPFDKTNKESDNKESK